MKVGLEGSCLVLIQVLFQHYSGAKSTLNTNDDT